MQKLYVLGDSISIQYGPYLEAALTGVMQYSRKEGEEEALLNLNVPMGANAGDSSMVLEFLQGKARSGGIETDYLLLNCGLHDLKAHAPDKIRQVSIEQYEQNLRAVVKLVGQMGPQLIWARITHCKDAEYDWDDVHFFRHANDAVVYNQMADKIMQEAGVPVIDLYTFTRNLGGDELYCDHVHFNEDVRQKQGAFIAGWLQGYLCR